LIAAADRQPVAIAFVRKPQGGNNALDLRPARYMQALAIIAHRCIGGAVDDRPALSDVVLPDRCGMRCGRHGGYMQRVIGGCAPPLPRAQGLKGGLVACLGLLL
jgi:hypothetical protein